MNILIRNADIVTVNENNFLVENANLGIKDDIIEFIKPVNQGIPNFDADKIIDATGKIVMPGLVNAHTHSAMTVFRNFSDDLPLNDWLFKKIIPAEAKLTEEDVYWGTLLGIAEMIRSGITMFADMYYHMDHVAGAVEESKIKANLCMSLLSIGSGKERYQETVDYFKNWNSKSDGKIKVYLEIHSAYLFNKNSLINTANLAKELNTGIHTHLLETLWEREEVFKMYGMDSVSIYNQSGVFDVPVFAAHGVHLDDSDIGFLKQKDVSIIHSPTSNLKLGSGIAPIPKIKESGINVALGTDGAASNNNLNMFEEMNMAALIHKGANMDPIIMNTNRVLKMASCNGAKALGFNDTGIIKEGMKADVIILNTDQIHFYPKNNIVSALVYSAQASDVDTVIADGRLLMEGRQLTTIDEEKVKAKVTEISKRICG